MVENFYIYFVWNFIVYKLFVIYKLLDIVIIFLWFLEIIWLFIVLFLVNRTKYVVKERIFFFI